MSTATKIREVDSRIHELGHLYHAYLRSGRSDLANKALELLHNLEHELEDEGQPRAVGQR